MAIKSTYDINLNILFLTVNGSLSFDDFKDCMVKLLSSNDYPPDVDTIWDLNNMEFDSFDLTFHQQVVDFIETNDNPRGYAHVAIVSNYDIGKGVINLFIQVADCLHQTFKAFKNLDEAILWRHQLRKN